MHSRIKTRIYEDIQKRSRNGAYIYTAAWLAIGLGTGFFRDFPEYFYTFLSIFVCLGIFRVSVFLIKPSIDKNTHKFWTATLQFNAIAPAITMSVLFALSMLIPAFSSIYFYLLMTMFAMLSGGVVNFAPHPRLSVLYLISLVLPTFIGAFLFSNNHNTEAAMLVLYGFFMYALGRRLSKEYLQLISQQEELERLNNQDSLTGIANRRLFDKRFATNWETHSRSNLPLSLIIIDIDHFKKVNDNFGHAAGDVVIRDVANMIKTKFKRNSDCVARIGGEEFGVLMPLTDFKKVSDMADELRQTVEASPIDWEGESIKVTVSGGVASCLPSHLIKSIEMFKLADNCLYQAKNEGRNKTIAKTFNDSQQQNS